MQILPYVAGALALTTTQAKAQTTTKCLASQNESSSYFTVPLNFAHLFPAKREAPVELAERAVSGYGLLGTRWNKCVDVPSGNFKGGQAPQLWDCNGGNNNQQWKLSGNTVRTLNNMCLDVPSGWAYAGAPLQLWACDNNNQNQFFEAAGIAIRKRNTNFCLDVRDGHYDNGAGLQLWYCDFNNNGNQNINFGQSQTATQQSPSSFLGYATVSWDKFAQLHPECAPFGSSFQSAAAALNLVPTLLGALAMTEAGCQEKPSNGFGMFQFMDDNAWQRYGGPGANKQKASDAIWGGARYIRALLDQDGQNLDAALRDYNGPVWQGGNPNYQAEIRTWMSGGSVW